MNQRIAANQKLNLALPGLLEVVANQRQAVKYIGGTLRKNERINLKTYQINN